MIDSHQNPTPSMTAFTDGMKKTVLRFVAIFLALALLGALWSTALTQLSERQTAVTLLTKAGTDLINPLLTANGSGVGQSLYQQLAANAQANPQAALNLPFLKVRIPGSAIAGKNFADGSKIIYSQVASAYYDRGPSGAFVLPPQLQPIVDSYTPFVQSGQGYQSPLPNVPIPQLPSFLTNLVAVGGITPTSLTATGHQNSQSNSTVLWIVSVILALVLVLMNTGWTRLWSVAWSVFHSSWHIAAIGVIGTILTHRNIANTGPYAGVLDLIGATFMPVFYIAAVAGILGIVVSLIGQHLTSDDKTKQEAKLATVSVGASALPPTWQMPQTHDYPPPQGEPQPPSFPPAS